jgi:hypothetical protein
MSEELINEYNMNERVDRLTSRHIAKCLDFLGDSIAPVQMQSIKRSFRFFSEDIKTLVAHGDTHNDQDEQRFNR